MNASISAILSEMHGIANQPGSKIECPFCHHQTFSIKCDDLLGKCFHPACGYFITPNRRDGQSRHSLASVLESIYHDFFGHPGANSPSPLNPGCQPATPGSLVWYQIATSLPI
jgi:hypothetical protein